MQDMPMKWWLEFLICFAVAFGYAYAIYSQLTKENIKKEHTMKNWQKDFERRIEKLESDNQTAAATSDRYIQRVESLTNRINEMDSIDVAPCGIVTFPSLPIAACVCITAPRRCNLPGIGGFPIGAVFACSICGTRWVYKRFGLDKFCSWYLEGGGGRYKGCISDCDHGQGTCR